MTSTNYTGRKVDLALFPDLKTEYQAVSGRFSDFPRAIAGIAKLSQNYLRALLTPLGHYKSDPDYGSNLQSKMTTQRIRFPSDVLHAFVIESDRVASYLHAQETEETPMDERFGKATLVGQNLIGGQIELTIELESASEETVSLLVPVSWST